eukprot:gene7316-8134_t
MASSLSSKLFTSDDGKPLSFIFHPCPLKAEIRRLVEAGGGELSSKFLPESIRLTDKEDSVSEGLVHVDFIFQSVQQNCLQDIDSYRVKSNERKTVLKCGEKNGRSEYLCGEDQAIIDYIKKNAKENGAGSISGNQIWKQMQEEKVTRHPWQSMRSRYLKHLADDAPKHNYSMLAVGNCKGKEMSFIQHTPSSFASRSKYPDVNETQKNKEEVFINLSDLNSAATKPSKPVSSSTTTKGKQLLSKESVKFTEVYREVAFVDLSMKKCLSDSNDEGLRRSPRKLNEKIVNKKATSPAMKETPMTRVAGPSLVQVDVSPRPNAKEHSRGTPADSPIVLRKRGWSRVQDKGATDTELPGPSGAHTDSKVQAVELEKSCSPQKRQRYKNASEKTPNKYRNDSTGKEYQSGCLTTNNIRLSTNARNSKHVATTSSPRSKKIDRGDVEVDLSAIYQRSLDFIKADKALEMLKVFKLRSMVQRFMLRYRLDFVSALNTIFYCNGKLEDAVSCVTSGRLIDGSLPWNYADDKVLKERRSIKNKLKIEEVTERRGNKAVKKRTIGSLAVCFVVENMDRWGIAGQGIEAIYSGKFQNVPHVSRSVVEPSTNDPTFDDLDIISSEHDAKEVQVEPSDVAEPGKSSRKYIIGRQDVMKILARKKKNQDGNEAGTSSGGNAKPSQRLLKHLEMLKEMKEANGSCTISSAGKMEEFSLAKRKWWQKKDALTKKDLLTISIDGMDTYKDRVDEMMELVAEKGKRVENLKMMMDGLETNYRERKIEYVEERQKYQIEGSLMKRKLATIMEEKQTLELKFADLLEKSQSDENENRKNVELFQTAKESLEKKNRLVSDLDEQVKIIELMLEEANAKNEEETSTLKEELIRKVEDIEKMMNTISILEAAQKASVSVEEMNACKDLVDRKSSELQDMAALVAEREELVESLKMKVDSLETSNRECKEECETQKQRYQNERSSMVRKIAMLKKKRKVLKLECADLLEKLQSENKMQDQNMEMLQTTKESLDEKNRVVSDLNERVKILESMLEEADATCKEETATLKEELIRKEEDIEKMKNTISILEAVQKASTDVDHSCSNFSYRFGESRYLKVSRDVELNTLKQERDEMQEELFAAKKRIKDFTDSLSDKASCMNRNRESRGSEDVKKICNDFAALKLENSCSQQTLFYGNDLGKLIEENQGLRRELEKTSQENDVLKNAMQENEEPKKMQRRATELLAKESEMPRCGVALHEESMKETEMKQTLEQSDHCEHCIVTMESMAELQIDCEEKSFLVKKLKSKLRIFTQQYEDLLFEFKDKARDLVSVKARFDKSLARLVKADERNILVEEENLRLSRNYSMLTRELKAARVELSVLKVRYGNAEEACKEHE